MSDEKFGLGSFIASAEEMKAKKMKINTFHNKMKHLDACVSEYRPTKQLISDAETILGVTFGDQLKDYLLTYGFLYIGPKMFFGINSFHKEESTLISHTLQDWNNIPETRGKIVLDDSLEFWVFLIDEQDKMYVYSMECGLVPMDMDFFDYLIKEFDEWNYDAPEEFQPKANQMYDDER